MRESEEREEKVDVLMRQEGSERSAKPRKPKIQVRRQNRSQLLSMGCKGCSAFNMRCSLLFTNRM